MYLVREESSYSNFQYDSPYSPQIIGWDRNMC